MFFIFLIEIENTSSRWVMRKWHLPAWNFHWGTGIQQVPSEDTRIRFQPFPYLQAELDSSLFQISILITDFSTKIRRKFLFIFLSTQVSTPGNNLQSHFHVEQILVALRVFPILFPSLNPSQNIFPCAQGLDLMSMSLMVWFFAFFPRQWVCFAFFRRQSNKFLVQIRLQGPGKGRISHKEDEATED